jgi:hypothetical protein
MNMTVALLAVGLGAAMVPMFASERLPQNTTGRANSSTGGTKTGNDMRSCESVRRSGLCDHSVRP